jgi:hypothetical protein
MRRIGCRRLESNEGQDDRELGVYDSPSRLLPNCAVPCRHIADRSREIHSHLQLESPEFNARSQTTVEFGKRLAGLLLSAMIVWIFIRPVVKWMLHPVGRKTTSAESPLPPGIARWDMLGSALFCIGCSYFLLTRPERSLELMFTAERSRLQDKTKLRLWTLEVQMAAVLMLIWSLLPTVDFVRSLRH